MSTIDLDDYILDQAGHPVSPKQANHDDDEDQHVIWVKDPETGEQTMYRSYHPKSIRLCNEAIPWQEAVDDYVQTVEFGEGKAPAGLEANVPYTQEQVDAAKAASA